MLRPRAGKASEPGAFSAEGPRLLLLLLYALALEHPSLVRSEACRGVWWGIRPRGVSCATAMECRISLPR